MQVEQRIGRIDRLGQEHPTIRIVNLHYEDTVETDVYLALRRRIDLFQTFVGRLQPILARVSRAIEEATLRPAAERERLRAELAARLEADIGEAESEGFDVDALAEVELDAPPRPPAPCDLEDLHQILDQPHLLPAGIEAKPLGGKDFAYLQPGMPHPVRITTDPEFFDAHPDSSELWSPGSPLFPKPEWVGDASAPALAEFRKALPE